MHVILKPFIKLAIMVLTVLGIAELAGVDVEELIEKLMGYITDAGAEEEASSSEADA